MTDTSIYKFKHGDVFHGRYTLDRLIGAGGFADVWKAVDNLTGEVVALKIYTNLTEEGIRDLAKEYTQVHELNHTNILRAAHFDTDGNIPYLEMKYCEGGSLDKQIGIMSDTEALRMIREIAVGLKYLHDNHVVHQDIKPANMLIDKCHDNYYYVLTDFGISARTRTRLHKSVNGLTGRTKMTEAYAPPEKFSPKKSDRLPDRKGDIFSFGITVYELLTGTLPFDDFPTGRQLQYEPTEIDFTCIANERIRTFVQWCMAREKEDRPTADDIIAYLDSGTLPQPHAQQPGAVQYPSDEDDITVPPGGGTRGPGSDAIAPAPVAAVVADRPRLWTVRRLRVVFFVLVAVAFAALLFLLLGHGRQCPAVTTEVDTVYVSGIPVEMVLVPGGNVRVDVVSDDPASGSKTRVVQIEDFYIARTEVTRQLWDAVMGIEQSADSCANLLPVDSVSYNDCKTFLAYLNYMCRDQGVHFRLPTEAEWEYAARAVGRDGKVVHRDRYDFAGSNDADDVAWHAGNSGGHPHAPGEKSINTFGIVDMSGNVAEWCERDDKSKRKKELAYPLRGGHYGAAADDVTAGSRMVANAADRSPYYGLRLVMSRTKTPASHRGGNR